MNQEFESQEESKLENEDTLHPDKNLEDAHPEANTRIEVNKKKSHKITDLTIKDVHEEIKKYHENYAELLDKIMSESTENKTHLMELVELLKEKKERDQYKDEAILRMQKRLDEYEKDILKSIKETLIRDIILFSDSLFDFYKKFKSGDCSSKEFNHELKLLLDELFEILFSQNVEIIKLTVNQKFDRNYQKVIRTEATENPDEDEMVSRIIRAGFFWGDKILRKQEIVVKKFKEELKNTKE